jgi:excisionase family DNA binding protein
MTAAKSRLSVVEICQDLGLGRARVYEMLESRIIPNVRVGRTWVVTRHAYEQWKRTCGLGPEAGRSLHVS